jgi:phospholipid transport system transporter-binding protein
VTAALQRVSDNRWRLTGTLDFDSVPELRPRIREALSRGANLTVDLGGITHTNSAGVALLLQWMEDARRKGATIRLQDPPREFRELAGLSNTHRLLGL